MYNRTQTSTAKRAQLNETPFKQTVAPSTTKQDDFGSTRHDLTMPKPSKTANLSCQDTEDTINKKRKVKASSSLNTLELVDQHKQKYRFPLFRDVDLGIEKGKQVLVHTANNDDDYFTDDEQLTETIRYCLYEVKEGIKKEFQNLVGNANSKNGIEQDQDDASEDLNDSSFKESLEDDSQSDDEDAFD